MSKSRHKTESITPESLEVLCARLESAIQRNSGTPKGNIYAGIYDKLRGEYESLKTNYFQVPDLFDVTTNGYIELNRQLADIYMKKISDLDGKVLIVGYDHDGIIGVDYEKSYSAAMDAINGNAFNGPVVWYKFSFSPVADKDTGQVKYVDVGRGRIIIRPWVPIEAKTQRSMPAVKEDDTSHILVAAK